MASAGQALPMLDATSYVSRYAWFALPPYQTLGLANSDGSLTSVGAAYRVPAAPREGPCRPALRHQQCCLSSITMHGLLLLGALFRTEGGSSAWRSSPTATPPAAHAIWRARQEGRGGVVLQQPGSCAQGCQCGMGL